MSAPHDVIVIGGGLAGSSAAFHLARAGRDVALVEREAGPRDKVCGEFLSYEALHYLAGMDIDPIKLGAPEITTLRLAGASSVISQRLAFPASSLSRRRLDEALLTRAAEAGCKLRRGQGVKALERRNGIWVARLGSGERIEAREAFLATGKHDLKGWPRPPGRQNDLVGLKLHFRLTYSQTAELAGAVELFVFDGGYGGLEPIEDGLANLCLLVRKSRFAEFGHRWDALYIHILEKCPHLKNRLSNAEQQWNKPLAITSIPYGFVRRGPSEAWHLGDQAAVIPSFCGEGMSIALHSGALAASFHLAGYSPSQFQHRLAGDVSRQVGHATLLSRALMTRTAGPAMLAALRFLPGSLPLIGKATRLRASALLACDGAPARGRATETDCRGPSNRRLRNGPSTFPAVRRWMAKGYGPANVAAQPGHPHDGEADRGRPIP